MSDDISSLKEAEKVVLHEETEHGIVHHKSNWAPGVALILLGTIFLFITTTEFALHNWWALFILLPAVANFGQAMERWRRSGRFSHAVRGPLTGAVILAMVAGAFLFDLDWSFVWPFFLIVAGVMALLGGMLDR